MRRALLALATALLAHCAAAVRIVRPWTTKHWCESAFEPRWPFAYAVRDGAGLADKRRTASSRQSFGHVCARRGASSKCHICEDIACDSTAGNGTCHLQLQGVDWAALPRNVPSPSDSPWSVGGAHRNDFGAASRLCVMLGGGDCLLPGSTDFSACPTRCWGADSAPPSPRPSPNPEHVRWEVDKAAGNPQGKVTTLAGGSGRGHRDGAAATALFNRPQAVAVDADRNVFVADTFNHAVRRIDAATGAVTTVAGVPGQRGYRDGDAATARFATPSGIAVFYNGTAGGTASADLVVVIADTDNHRIRALLPAEGRVFTLSGRRGDPDSEPGFGDGSAAESRFDHPAGLACDADGTTYVADRSNHLVRAVDRFGTASTIAGELVTASELAGCPPPCLTGNPGYRDGALDSARFRYPADVSLGPNATLLVAEGHRVRRVTLDPNSTVHVQRLVSRNRVITVAGSPAEGDRDGPGDEARFVEPRGVHMTADGHTYVADSTACRLRRIATTALIARDDVTCATTVTAVVRPDGCAGYDAPFDALDRRASSMVGSIQHNVASETEGRDARPCVGFPPLDAGTQFTGVTADPRNGTQTAPFQHQEMGEDTTRLLLRCPAGCGASAGAGAVVGSGTYADTSLACAAAVHAGEVDDAAGGWVVVELRGNVTGLAGSDQHGVSSAALAAPWGRTFVVRPLDPWEVRVETIVGPPSAPLEAPLPCGYSDGQPPQEARLNVPTGIAAAAGASLSATETLVVADTENDAVRAVTAVCAQACENGGVCDGPNTCSCPTGWGGEDCTSPQCATACGANRVCTGPDECTCKPGFGGAACDQPLCVQTCANGGTCTAPDTCSCAAGWYDANCTTPVCAQTCGNGGNCTAPDTCSCPSQWAGSDCRSPVCPQGCANGGVCVAPGTCRCEVGWSGHDCSKPVCTQGYLVTDPAAAAAHSAPASPRPDAWDRYRPCVPEEHCNATHGFDCAQPARAWSPRLPAFGPGARSLTGFATDPTAPGALPEAVTAGLGCARIEVVPAAVTPFRYENGSGGLGPYARLAPLDPYPWDAVTGPWRAPGPAPADRQVALVTWVREPQGVYVCANGGNCTAPDKCRCAPGWVGFDCRTPVCRQGYFEEGDDGRTPLGADQFPDWAGHPDGQGAYECSIRAHTPWERAKWEDGTLLTYVHDHPNYYSRYMDGTAGDYARFGVWPSQGGDMGFGATHYREPPAGNDTNEGWRRDGWWVRDPSVPWLKGRCTPEFERVCPDDAGKVARLWGDAVAAAGPTTDTNQTFFPRVTFSIYRAFARGRWRPRGGECVDHVLRGCYNNGTCVAPDTCRCADGWTGHSCLTPVCSAPCANGGNCTLPDTCTCEKGWEGPTCEQPVCAQACLHGGSCVAPDTCSCPKWANTWRDRREAGGRPLYRKPDGDPQDTGWTGFDCSTPICTQAEQFVLNDASGSVRLGGYGRIIEGSEPTNNLHGQSPPPPYEFPRDLEPGDGQVLRNDGRSFQSGCDETSPRYSDDFLCNVLKWEQGDYLAGRRIRVNHNFLERREDDVELWKQGPVTRGEGIYACYNRGSCIKPDNCTCPDGWAGHDCNQPLCRHLNAFEDVVTCQNDAVCVGKDACTCITARPALYELYPALEQRREADFETGWAGSDCSIAKCTQGFFDQSCKGVASGGEGCYRCLNGGNCTAPDLCTCTADYRGYDCGEPICFKRASTTEIFHLDTVDKAKVEAFEEDPCFTSEMVPTPEGLKSRGNCTAPDTCECLCIEKGEPWSDPLGGSLPQGYTYGTGSCANGFEGTRAADGRLLTCHLRIKVPTWLERWALLLIFIALVLAFLAIVGTWYGRRWLKARKRRKKSQMRRSRRSSAEMEAERRSLESNTMRSDVRQSDTMRRSRTSRTSRDSR